MPRLFTGIEIPPEIAARLKMLQTGLEGVRWIEPSDFHITLRFLGDVSYETANELASALENIDMEPFPLQLSELDAFGKSKPHSVHAKVERSEPLDLLQMKHERVCQTLGLSPEPRNYLPHVTVARVRGQKPEKIANYLSSKAGFLNLEFIVSRFVIYSCKDSVGGGPYIKEVTFDLEKGVFV